ncbi:unnamed protein product [Gordionus sp. m RMFG-2023]
MEPLSLYQPSRGNDRFDGEDNNDFLDSNIPYKLMLNEILDFDVNNSLFSLLGGFDNQDSLKDQFLDDSCNSPIEDIVMADNHVIHTSQLRHDFEVQKDPLFNIQPHKPSILPPTLSFKALKHRSDLQNHDLPSPAGNTDSDVELAMADNLQFFKENLFKNFKPDVDDVIIVIDNVNNGSIHDINKNGFCPTRSVGNVITDQHVRPYPLGPLKYASPTTKSGCTENPTVNTSLTKIPIVKNCRSSNVKQTSPSPILPALSKGSRLPPIISPRQPIFSLSRNSNTNVSDENRSNAINTKQQILRNHDISALPAAKNLDVFDVINCTNDKNKALINDMFQRLIPSNEDNINFYQNSLFDIGTTERLPFSSKQSHYVKRTIDSPMGMYGSNEEHKQSKRLERMIKNRESASLSRKRKKEYIKSLESRVEQLSKEKRDLEIINGSLKTKINSLETENCVLKKVLPLLKATKPGVFFGVAFLFLYFLPFLTNNRNNNHSYLDSLPVGGPHSNLAPRSVSYKGRLLMSKSIDSDYYIDMLNQSAYPLPHNVKNITAKNRLINLNRRGWLESLLRAYFYNPSNADYQHMTNLGNLRNLSRSTTNVQPIFDSDDAKNLSLKLAEFAQSGDYFSLYPNLDNLLSPNPAHSIPFADLTQETNPVSTTVKSLKRNRRMVNKNRKNPNGSFETKPIDYWMYQRRAMLLSNDQQSKPPVENADNNSTQLNTFGKMSYAWFNLMLEFMKNIRYQNDTYYLFSIFPDMFFPALNNSDNIRPKMSLVMPNLAKTNLSKFSTDQISMMQFDCKITEMKPLILNKTII